MNNTGKVIVAATGAAVLVWGAIELSKKKTPPAGSAIFEGTVTDKATGIGLKGVAITLTADVSDVYTTSSAADGSFSVSVPPGNYNVDFTLKNYQEATMAITLTVGNNNGSESMTKVTAILTVNVHDSVTGGGINGVTVTLSGSGTASQPTDVNGMCAFSNMIVGGTYTVALSKTGYTPASFSTTIVAGTNTLTKTLVADVSVATFAGNVNDAVSGIGLNGVVITLTNQSTGTIYTVTSAASGTFSINVPPGVYSVNYHFTGYTDVNL